MRKSSARSVVGFIGLMLVAPGLLHAAATAAPAGEDGALYPRKLTDLKATLQSLSPQKDARNPNDAFLARLKQFRYLCGVPYEDLQIEGYFNVDVQGFGCGPAIIFRPDDLKLKDDSRYKVEITGLKAKNGQPATIRYLVHFVNMEKM